MTKYWQRIKTPSSAKRFIFFLLSDIVLIVFSLFLSFLFHFDFEFGTIYLNILVEVLPFFIAIKLVCFWAFRMYRMTWRYVGIFDLANIVIASVVAGMVLIILSLPISFLPFKMTLTGFPKRIILEDCIISIIVVGGLRISKRIYLEVLHRQRPIGQSKRTLVLGAGNTGEMIVRDMARNNFFKFYPVGFLDDDRAKVGMTIHGTRVIDTTERLRDTIVNHKISALVIAIPTLNHKKLKEIYGIGRRLNIEAIKIVPRIYNYDKPDVNQKGLEDGPLPIVKTKNMQS